MHEYEIDQFWTLASKEVIKYSKNEQHQIYLHVKLLKQFILGVISVLMLSKDFGNFRSVQFKEVSSRNYKAN